MATLQDPTRAFFVDNCKVGIVASAEVADGKENGGTEVHNDKYYQNPEHFYIEHLANTLKECPPSENNPMPMYITGELKEGGRGLKVNG